MSAEYTLYSRIEGIEAGTQTVTNDDDENGKHWQDSESATQYFKAVGRANRGDFAIDGQCREVDGVMKLSWKRSFPTQHYPPQFWDGVWDPATSTISGTCGLDDMATSHPASFVFKRMTPEHTCFMPAPLDLEENKPRALWGFAIAAVLNDVRRKRYSWTFFKERRDNRKRYIELLIRLNYGELNEEEQWELARIRQTLTAADARLYETRYDYELRTTPIHL